MTGTTFAGARARTCAVLTVVLLAGVIAACGSSASTTNPAYRQILTPSRPVPGQTITVELSGVPADQTPVSSGTATLLRLTNGQRHVVYTLFALVPGQPVPHPAFVRGRPTGATAALGYPHRVRFVLAETLEPGKYELERWYSYGPSGGQTDQTDVSRFAVIKAS